MVKNIFYLNKSSINVDLKKKFRKTEHSFAFRR